MYISGHVYDESGNLVDGATVTVKEFILTPRNEPTPFAANPITSDGAWVVKCAPKGGDFEFVATKKGWTRRRQVYNVGSLDQAVPEIVDFGWDGTTPPPYHFGAYFISDRPEVEYVEPKDGAQDIDPTRLHVKLRISEWLPDASRDRLAEAIRVFPLSLDVPLPPEDDFSRVRLWSLDAKYPAAIRAGTNTTGDPNVEATTTWNSDGTEITLAYDQPLARGTKYAIALAAPEAGPILDASGFPLGVGMDGTARATAVPGELLLGAFKDEYLSITPQRQLSGGDARWQSTHLNATTFTTAP